MARLQNKVALVFGAGPNIGGTTAYFLAREGAAVLVTDIVTDAARETAEFIQGKGFNAAWTVCNARIESEVSAAIQKAVEIFGRVDVIVNMAGRVHWSHTLDMKLDDWQDAVSSFATAGLLTTQYAARQMINQGQGGSIIHLLSTAAHFGEADGAAYCAAKAALLNFARSAAMDLAHHQIRVNTVTPCSMEHQLWTTMKDEMFDPAWQKPDRLGFYSRQEYLDQLPLRRFPKASDLAWATVFLASDEAACITGIDIPVDAGLRHKYPTWSPGRHHPVSINDYARNTSLTRFGEAHQALTDVLGQPCNRENE